MARTRFLLDGVLANGALKAQVFGIPSALGGFPPKRSVSDNLENLALTNYCLGFRPFSVLAFCSINS